MARRLAHITVGAEGADVRGADNRAIQIAINALPSDGGTVEILEGAYTCIDSVHLRSGVRLVGQGEKTIFRRADGFEVLIKISADYGQLKITPVDVAPFAPGRGLYIRDNRSGGWLDSIITVESIEGGALHFAEPLVMDYSEEEGGIVIASGSVISGVDVEDVAIENLTVDGNKDNNIVVGGCQAGGIYFHRARRVKMTDVALRDFAGDGISFQTTQDFHLERVASRGCTGIGVHPGTGSAGVVMTDCTFSDNGTDGYFQCWRVQHGRFENVLCENNGHAGLSIGHKDTDNVFIGCTFRGNGRAGILFREENENNAGHRNTFESCLIENNNAVGVEVAGHVHDCLFENCTIRETRPAKGKQAVGIVLGKDSRSFRTTGCTWQGHADGDVRDLTGGAGGHEIDA